MQGFFVHYSDIRPISFSDLNNSTNKILYNFDKIRISVKFTRRQKSAHSAIIWLSCAL